MASGKHEIVMELSVNRVWEFVKDMNNWAPLVPGYIEHNIINEKQSTWKFTSDIGILKKDIHMQIDIREWLEPTKVTFDLTGINENFRGSGYFLSESVGEGEMKMTGFLDISAKGMMGPMINAVLQSYVPTLSKELTEAIGNKLKEET